MNDGQVNSHFSKDCLGSYFSFIISLIAEANLEVKEKLGQAVSVSMIIVWIACPRDFPQVSISLSIFSLIRDLRRI